MTPRSKDSLKKEVYQHYFTTNMKSALSSATIVKDTVKEPYPAIGIYCGQGASHSWLWFVEIMDAMGFWQVQFLDEASIKEGELAHLDVLLISGGDTFALAEGLGQEGSQQLHHFLTGGGLYLGSCAGAYLPLNSSLSPLNLFNYVSAKISNLAHTLPPSRALPEKMCTSYGCHYIIHPVREEVRIKVVDVPWRTQDDEVIAPLYGGPAFLPSEDVDPVAYYTGFTPKTLFLTDAHIAHDTLVGNAAIITKRIGDGQLFLLGPHLEHPHYPPANTLIAEILHHATRTQNHYHQSTPPPSIPPCTSQELPTLLRSMKAELSNARIVALSLEREPMHWHIGHKVYEPEKIRVFLEAMWKRWSTFSSQKYSNEPELYAMYTMAQTLTQQLKAIKQSPLSEGDDPASVKEMFVILKALAASFLTIYFRERMTLITKGGIP